MWAPGGPDRRGHPFHPGPLPLFRGPQRDQPRQACLCPGTLAQPVWEVRDLLAGTGKKGVVTQSGNPGHTYGRNARIVPDEQFLKLRSRLPEPSNPKVENGLFQEFFETTRAGSSSDEFNRQVSKAEV